MDNIIYTQPFCYCIYTLFMFTNQKKKATTAETTKMVITNV